MLIPLRRDGSVHSIRPMAFLDRLLPAWRHRDPDVRAAAVRQLGVESQDVLASVARTDSDARVRRVAVKKLNDADLLLEIGRTDADEEVRRLAGVRAEELLVEQALTDGTIGDCMSAWAGITRPSNQIMVATRAAHRDVRRAALGAITDQHALAEVARRGDDPQIGLEALTRISEVALLQRIAGRDAPPAVALAAVERIDDPSVLQAIANDRAAQKAVRKQARTRAATLSGDDHPMRVAARRERQTHLCIIVEQLIDARDAEVAFNTLRVAEQDWHDLSSPTPADPILDVRFRRACAAAHASIVRTEQLHDAAERRTAAHRHHLQTRQHLCESVEALNGAEVPAAIAAARARWQALGPIDDPESRELSARFTQAVERCEQRYERWQARESFRTELEALVREAEQLLEARDPRAASRPRAALERRWERLVSSPAGAKWLADEHALQQRFTEAGAALPRQAEALAAERQQREHAARAHLASLCQRLEQLAQRETVTAAAAERATAAAADAETHLRVLPGAERATLRDRLTQARQSLMQRVDALTVTEEWRRWANAEVQQQLITEAEALLASDDPQRMLGESARLDQEWKRAAVAPRDQSQALWDRFRTARRELRQRTDAYLAENLARKESLCRDAEGFADSTDWNVAATALRRMQDEWKQIGPVRPQLSAALFARFRAPANRFFERHKEYRQARKEQYNERVGRMRTLCEAAERLAESTDWEATATELRELQRSAQEVWGRRPAPSMRPGEQPRETDALRQQFDVACSRFFDRYRKRDSLELEAKLAVLERILNDLDSLRLSLASAASPEAADVMQPLKDRLAEWAAGIGALPPQRASAFNQRLQAVCDAIEASYPGGFPEGALDAESNLPQREKLCVRLERLAESVATDTGQPEDLAESLKRALAARTIGGPTLSPREQSRHDAQEAAARLCDKWQRLGPVIGPRARTLGARFAQATAQISVVCRGLPGSDIPQDN